MSGSYPNKRLKYNLPDLSDFQFGSLEKVFNIEKFAAAAMASYFKSAKFEAGAWIRDGKCMISIDEGEDHDYHNVFRFDAFDLIRASLEDKWGCAESDEKHYKEAVAAIEKLLSDIKEIGP